MTAASLLRRSPSCRPLLAGRGLCWRWCRFAVTDVREVRHLPLHLRLPEDLSGAVARRRSEYLAGRLCAALALRDAGVQAVEVGRIGRRPVWPEGASGSISHAGDFAAAVVDTAGQPVGLDCEWRFSPETTREVGPMILTEADQAHRPGDWEPARYATLIFSAKEAVYKALSGELDDIPDFTEARVLALNDGCLRIALRGWRARVRYRYVGGLCVTLARRETGPS